jgi:ATP-binding cassette subfamily F protein 3
MESTESGSSAREERKAAKEQKKWLSELDSKFVIEEGGGGGGSTMEEENMQISNMTLPEYGGGRNEKDIQVNNISITFGGKLLLDGADLRIVYGRRYGLIGKNGIGKTTLLRHMASFDIEGFPRHHRILHVKQVCLFFTYIEHSFNNYYSNLFYSNHRK